VPAGVIALWKMHNWEFLQTYDPPVYVCAKDEATVPVTGVTGAIGL
jgi:hypothetical protein